MSSCSPAGPDGRCELCGDVAVAARVTAIDLVTSTAVVETDDAALTVALDLVDDVSIGELLLVHQGFAIARLGAP